MIRCGPFSNSRLIVIIIAQVNKLKPGGAAERSHIDPGDCIVSANGHNLTGLSKSEALQVIKAAGNRVALELIRPFSDTSTSSSGSSQTELSYFQRIAAHLQSKRESRKSSLESGKSTPKHSHSTEQSKESSSEDHNAEVDEKDRLPYIYKPGPQNQPLRRSFQSSLSKNQQNRKDSQGVKVQESESTSALSHQSRPSEKDVVAKSMDNGHADSWKIAQQWAPQTPHPSGRGAPQTPHPRGWEGAQTPQPQGRGAPNTEASLAQGGANYRTPQPSKCHRESKNSQGEILTFTNRRSTLPRQINGSKVGVRLVELQKGTGFLGMQLEGDESEDSPIIVKSVLKGGAAYKSGKIHEGDEILEVNGVSFERANLKKALKFMRKLPQGKVSLILRRGQDQARRRLFYQPEGCQYNCQ